MVKEKKVLIVDDILMTGESGMRRLLSEYNVGLEMVASYDEALEKLKGNGFDLVIVDVILKGDKDGLALIRKVRETDKETVIVVITGQPGAEYKEEARAAGANSYIRKPLQLRKHILARLGVI